MLDTLLNYNLNHQPHKLLQKPNNLPRSQGDRLQVLHNLLVAGIVERQIGNPLEQDHIYCASHPTPPGKDTSSLNSTPAGSIRTCPERSQSPQIAEGAD